MKELWDERYSGEELIYGNEPNRFLAEFIDSEPPSSILFPAEGEGRNALYAASKGFQVYAFDFSIMGRKKALERAEKKELNIHYEIAGAEEWKTARSFNYIAIIYMHMLPDIRNRVHMYFADRLAPGGTLILETFSKKQLLNNTGGPKNIDMLYDVGILKDDFKSLTIKYIEEKEIILDEGKFHQGKASVIQMKAIKK